jgi:hypothetical protein
MGSSAPPLASGAPNLGSQPVAHAAIRGYNVAIGYLRGFLVILVLAHHSAVAYFWGVPTSRAPLLQTPSVASIPNRGPAFAFGAPHPFRQLQ